MAFFVFAKVGKRRLSRYFESFLKEIYNMFSVFLSSYRNTRESLGELENAVETPACGSSLHIIFRSPKLPLAFLSLSKNKVHVFYFSSDISTSNIMIASQNPLVHFVNVGKCQILAS